MPKKRIPRQTNSPDQIARLDKKIRQLVCCSSDDRALDAFEALMDVVIEDRQRFSRPRTLPAWAAGGLTARRRSVLPLEIRRLSLQEKITRAAAIEPDYAASLDAIVTYFLEEHWREKFYAGPRGGLKLANRPSAKNRGAR